MESEILTSNLEISKCLIQFLTVKSKVLITVYLIYIKLSCLFNMWYSHKLIFIRKLMVYFRSWNDEIPKTNLLSENNLIMIKLTDSTRPAFTCSNLTIETLEKGMKYVQG